MSRREYYFIGVQFWGLGYDGNYSEKECHCCGGSEPGLRFNIHLAHSEHVTINDSCCVECVYWLNANK